MYESFFGLQERPFSISPDPRFFFLSSQHKEALAKCQYAVQERMGLAVIYGDIGTGKTTIARRLFQVFSDNPDYSTAMLISPSLKTENALLREIMKEFGVPTQRSSLPGAGRRSRARRGVRGQDAPVGRTRWVRAVARSDAVCPSWSGPG
jgi:general secretion pathway protein A